VIECVHRGWKARGLERRGTVLTENEGGGWVGARVGEGGDRQRVRVEASWRRQTSNRQGEGMERESRYESGRVGMQDLG
jgi:hypothetical protein